MGAVHLVMIAAPLLALVVAAGSSATPGTAGSRLDAVRARYERLAATVAQPRIMLPATRAELQVRLESAGQMLAALAGDPLADFKRRKALGGFGILSDRGLS